MKIANILLVFIFLVSALNGFKLESNQASSKHNCANYDKYCDQFGGIYCKMFEDHCLSFCRTLEGLCKKKGGANCNEFKKMCSRVYKKF